LPAKYVIHTVGPVWNGGKYNEPQLLSNCYTNSLKLAVKNGIATIAFPNISTGVYGFPKLQAAQIAKNSVEVFLKNNNSIKTVFFIIFDDENFAVYSKIFNLR
jgi:O-acetyl-ADP-ribose deacetylase (regulator of RNase III)